MFVLHGFRWHDKVSSPRSPLVIPHAHIPPCSDSESPVDFSQQVSTRRLAAHALVRPESRSCPHLSHNPTTEVLSHSALSRVCVQSPPSRSFTIRHVDREDPVPCIAAVRSSLPGPEARPFRPVRPSFTSPSQFVARQTSSTCLPFPIPVCHRVAPRSPTVFRIVAA